MRVHSEFGLGVMTAGSQSLPDSHKFNVTSRLRTWAIFCSVSANSWTLRLSTMSLGTEGQIANLTALWGEVPNFLKGFGDP